MDTPSTALGSEWLSFHIVYHTGNRDRLLTDLVRPTVRALRQEGKLESFFFLRHVLGGPHIRLRIRPSPGSRDAVREGVRKRAASYLSSFPSPAQVSGSAARLLEESLQHQESEERQQAALADNSIHEIPFEPELERYGGPERIGKSLDFFALSSARALRLLDHRATVTAGEWLTVALRLEARYVLGFADDVADLASLIAEPQATLEAGEELIRARADQAFAESGDRLVGLLRGEIEKLGLAALSPLEDGEVARSLRRELADADRATRTRIFASQIHMTANRLGLARAEEAYVARILWRTFQRLEEADPATWSDLGDLLVCRTAREPSPARRLSDLLAPAFATL
ncbi:MAG TPA: thiopeptide-type bacteriocin biosynthesis protein [Thermoanaerobaculia bacterium]|jgi:thiopeptide-type bacteriocin biosynthesis protein|nr:thiopeptide-type bacteriocin biosynthesis protein [Thermoanaerobaculia bacterium]